LDGKSQIKVLGIYVPRPGISSSLSLNDWITSVDDEKIGDLGFDFNIRVANF